MYDRIHEEAFAVERVHFKKTKKRTSPKTADPFLALAGRLPVMVSAPHSVRRVQQGKVRPSTEFTGSLALLLHRETGCHALAVKKLYGGDPGRDDPCLYKERMGEIVGRQAVRAVLDFHGAAGEQDLDVTLGLVSGPHLQAARRSAGTLRDALHTEGIRRVAETVVPAAGTPTVTRFCCGTLGVAAVEIGINRRYRAPNRNGEDYGRLFRALANAIAALARG